MSHTPGPWEIESEDDDGVPYDDGVTITSAEGPVAFRVIDCSAPLISAAPELLGAARIALSMMGGDDSGPDDDEIHDEWERVRAAIRKATGQDPD
jgi:hypothetical protein